EVFRNKKAYQQMAEIADGRPVIFDGKYAIAAKYAFYTGKETFSQPNVSHRTSQWQYRDDDSGFVGRDVIIEVDPARYSEQEAKQRVKCAELANGREVYYVELSDFHPTRLVEIESNLMLPEEVKRGERFDFVLTINNPYSYDIEIDGEQYLLQMTWGWRKQQYRFYPIGHSVKIPAEGTVNVDCSFVVPDELPAQPYKVGFVVHHRDMYTWFNGEPQQTEIK
ncbi:MAG: hypothetical protein IKA01_08385, partial [Alistipes sp.]|nr:hypothetical protein [Alistipes sp.]